MSGPYAAAPYSGGLHSFADEAGFALGDFSALIDACSGAISPDDALRLRRRYGHSGQSKLDERLASLSVSNIMLVAADDKKWLAPV
jgi:hypothetical protein